MTDVNGLDILLAWVEFAILAGGVLAILLHRSGARAPRNRRRPAKRSGGGGADE